jgi:hypothetical protein
VYGHAPEDQNLPGAWVCARNSLFVAHTDAPVILFEVFKNIGYSNGYNFVFYEQVLIPTFARRKLSFCIIFTAS